MIFSWFKNRDNAVVSALYSTVVCQARLPVFYTDFCVRDDLDGRFDLVVLHLSLLLRHLRMEGDLGEELAKELIEYFIADMDSNLREVGISDTSVPKKVKQMAEALHGRSTSYNSALDQLDKEALGEAILRNVFRSADNPAALVKMVDYVAQSDQMLKNIDRSQIFDGTARFPSP